MMYSEFSLSAQNADYSTASEASDAPISRELALLALANISGIGHSTAMRLYDSTSFISLFSAARDEVHWIACAAHVSSPHVFTDGFMSQRERALELAETDLRDYARAGVTLLFDDDPRFPPRLREFDDRPRWLFIRGSVELLSDPRLITVVGTREPTEAGRSLAERVAAILVRRGFALVSGLAEGIDEIVHRVCVENGGQTVAVLGTGISNDFPASTSYLRNRILQYGGAIVTECFDKGHYSKQRFAQRNRIQAALSCSTVPVEPGVPSGSLDVVRFALTYGRQLLGVKWADTQASPLHGSVANNSHLHHMSQMFDAPRE
jgi:DNA processing protein